MRHGKDACSMRCRHDLELTEPPPRDFVLPVKYRPDKIMLHSRHVAGSLEPYHICRVMPSGEVFVAKGAALEDVAIVLLEHYRVSFIELRQIWDLEDLWDGPQT
jgi:hypothetical protein